MNIGDRILVRDVINAEENAEQATAKRRGMEETYMTMDTSTPNKAHLLQWARALESGNYEQGPGRLNKNNKFCCLGVACDIAKDDVGGAWERAEVEEPGLQKFVIGELTAETAYLPFQVGAWLGLESNDPILGDYSATQHNDGRNHTFTQIAAAIRSAFDLPTKEQDEHRLTWIKALESGAYTQGQGKLKSKASEFCCLGVACDLAAKDGIGHWETADSGEGEFVTDIESQLAVLPHPVIEWLGVSNSNPTLTSRAATTLNDQESLTFNDIAVAARKEFGFPSKEDEINAHRLAWIEALESGEYEQAEGTLKTLSGRYCCLGVACDLANKDGIGEWTSGGFKTDKEFRSAVMPDAVSEWLGLGAPNDGDLKLMGEYATQLNDNANKSFTEIAALAREEWGFPPKA